MLGLIKHKVDGLRLTFDELAFDFDAVLFGIDFDTEFVNSFPVDLDEALVDEFVRFAATGYTMIGEELIESYFLR